MIIVRQWAGLGNQLFIYAYYRALQEAGYEAKLDTSYYDIMSAYGGNGSYKVAEIFPGSKNVYATGAECRRLAVYQMDGFHRALRKAGINKKTYVSQTKRYHDCGWTPELMELPADAYVEGYFQSEKYFRSIAGSIRTELAFPLEQAGEPVHYISHMTNVNRPLSLPTADAISNGHSVSVHVRRGDYVNGQKRLLTDTRYYYNAIRRCAGEDSAAEFYVFSDDLDWCRDYFGRLFTDDSELSCCFSGDSGSGIPSPGGTGIAARFHYVDEAPAAWVDMYLMSLCRRHIIADSTFSWWGAWLDPRPDKTVFAPAEWVCMTEYAITDVVSEGWEKIPID